MTNQVKIQIDPASRRMMEETLIAFANATGKSVEEGINMMAYSSGRRLVNTVQPFGLKKGDFFIQNIRRQIEQVRWEVNAGVVSSTNIQSAHNRARRHGKVRLRSIQSKDYENKITLAEVEPYIRRQQAKAGRVKAAWVSAVESVGKAKMSGIPQWIRRHVPSPYGTSTKTGEGLKYSVTLENSTPYLKPRLQSKINIAYAVKDGLQNGMKRIKKITEKEIEKANRKLA